MNVRDEWQSTLIHFGIAKGLTPSAQHVGLILASFADLDGEHAWPSARRLGELAGKGRSTILKALSDLREGGWVEQVSRGSGGSGQPSEYRLTVPARLGR